MGSYRRSKNKNWLHSKDNTISSMVLGWWSLKILFLFYEYMYNSFYPLYVWTNHAVPFSDEHLKNIQNQIKQVSKYLINIQEEDTLLFHHNNWFYQGKHTFINLDKEKATGFDRILDYTKRTQQINTPNIRRTIAQTVTDLISDVYNKTWLISVHTSLSSTTGRHYSLKEIAEHQSIVISQLLEKIDPKNQLEFLRSYWELIKILDGLDEGIREFERMSDEERKLFIEKYQREGFF